MSILTLLAHGLARLAGWLHPKGMPGVLAGTQWSGSAFIDSSSFLIRKAIFRLTKPEKLKPPVLGLEVTTSYREIFNGLSLFEQIHSEQALNLNSPVSTGLPFRAKVLPPSEKTENKIIVNFAIDSHMLSFEKNAAGLQTASVDCVVQAYAKEDTPLKVEATTIHAELTDENYAKISSSYFPCQQTLSLPPGSYLLRLGVVDNRTGVLGTANARVKVD